MSFDLTQKIKVVNPTSNIDELYGVYPSISEALIKVPKALRSLGRTLGVIESGSVEEYWFKEGIEDSNLVKKITSSGGGGTTGDFMTLDSENEVIDNWSISNSENFNITPKLLALSDYRNTGNTITLDTLSQFPRLNIEDNYRGSSLSISSRPEFLFYYQNNNESKHATFSTKSIFLQDGSDSLELLTQYFGVRTSNLFANINFPLIGTYNYNLPLINENNEFEFNHTLVASVNGQFADKYGNIEIEGGTGGDYIPLTGTEEGKPVTGPIEISSDEKLSSFIGDTLTDDALGIYRGKESNYWCITPTGFTRIYNSMSLFTLGDEGFFAEIYNGVDDFTQKTTEAPLKSTVYYNHNNDFGYIQKKYADIQHSYSTTEIATGGTWVDNKPLYKKTQLTSDPAPTVGTMIKSTVVGGIYTEYEYTKP